MFNVIEGRVWSRITWSGSSLRWDSGLSLIVAIEVAGSSPVLRGVVVHFVGIAVCH
ncbi:MAG: hypothetical protein ACJARJ_001381 [Neptuniibacter pectenicola]|jgi:hypothetical protein